MLFVLDKSKTKPFLKSAKDPNKWVVTHPEFGSFECMPISINFNTGALNNTQWTVKVWETIGGELPFNKIDVKTDVANKAGDAVTTATDNVEKIISF